MSNITSQSWVPLPHVSIGQKVRVQQLSGQPALCKRLREMGFCEFAEIRILKNSGTMICQVCESRICLSRQLADSIMVEPAAA